VQWHSSPLSRAVETAQILSGAPPREEPALSEMDWGEWEGYGLDDLRQRFGDAFARNEAAGLDFRPPGGESPREVRDRVVRWLGEIAALGEPVVAVTHKGVLRAVLARRPRLGYDAQALVRRRAALHRFDVDVHGDLGLEVMCHCRQTWLTHRRSVARRRLISTSSICGDFTGEAA
jgi:probable phosphoglycerate mutase